MRYRRRGHRRRRRLRSLLTIFFRLVSIRLLAHLRRAHLRMCGANVHALCVFVCARVHAR